MSYLTQIDVDLSTARRQRLVDSYTWHRTIWESIPDRRDRKRDFLFRVDHLRTSVRAWVVSEEPLADPGWGTWRTAAIPEAFLERERYRFQLKVNPTIKRVVDWNGERRSNGVRVGIYSEDQLLLWAERKSRQHGFRLEHCVPSPPVGQPFRRNGVRGKHSSVDFAGVLAVTDRKRFKQAFRTGIGPAKAFGFGLLVLEPLGSAQNGGTTARTSNDLDERKWTNEHD